MIKTKTKKFVAILCELVLIFTAIICCIAYSESPLSAYAYSEDNYEEVGINFLKEQYNVKEFEYNSLQISDSINLYGAEDKVVAKLLILSRDLELDYVVLDFLADTIIAFGINEGEYLQNFYNKGNVYYAGLNNYAYFEDGEYHDLFGGELDSEVFSDTLDYYSTVPQEQADGSAGIMSWSSVRPDVTNNVSGGSVVNSNWDYIPGFKWTGVLANSSGMKATYFSQTTFNNQYNRTHTQTINGTCGPTAMTNMAVYFDWLGYGNALVSGSSQSTFEWFVQDLDWWNWTASNWWGNTKSSFKNYAKNRGYSYNITNYNNPSVNDFIKQIGNDRPIYTYLNVPLTNNRGNWAHAVVTVGYEKFTHTYKVNNRWWFFGWHDNWVTKTDDYYYLRCIDGWGTANSAQYIKVGFYSMKASAFTLK